MLYVILAELENCLTRSKFDNYIASELFQVESGQAPSGKKNEDGEDADEDEGAGCCGSSDPNSGMMKKRSMLPREFHNEIFTRDEMVLDNSKMGVMKKICCIFTCCCRSNRHADKVFAKARRLASDELNITSIIKA